MSDRISWSDCTDGDGEPYIIGLVNGWRWFIIHPPTTEKPYWGVKCSLGSVNRDYATITHSRKEAQKMAEQILGQHVAMLGAVFAPHGRLVTADVLEVKDGDKVRIVLEGTVRTRVAYPSQARVDILLNEDRDGLPTAGLFWFRDEFAPELLVYAKED